MEEKTSQALTRDLIAIALVGGSVKAAADQLLNLSPENRAEALGVCFLAQLQQLKPSEATDGIEKLGRRVEKILDELPNQEQAETINEMVNKDDTVILLSMVRGNAGGLSTVTSYLTEEQLEDLFNKDPEIADIKERIDQDRQRDERDKEPGLEEACEADIQMRSLNLVTTLLENPSANITRFFAHNDMGRQVMNRLARLASEDHEDAQHLLALHQRALAELVEEVEETTEEDNSETDIEKTESE